ncbi:MAG: DarT ssDNA thymidine ADP-ribosyltransferase family protein [Candidatus Wallbacteria bacterium]|nr:DarT ssDNA thymidine ADP-ribosyltransferase family protein [Candidatus Wallbacteria bacterium]
MTEKTKIRNQKLLYHLTALKNLPAIAEHGLLPRSEVIRLGLKYCDIADQEIIQKRTAYKLDDFLPFHFFAKNPFQGAVIKAHPDTEFILITIRRGHAKKNGFKILVKHPLSGQFFDEPEILDYAEGMEQIDWDAMETRDYRAEHCKQVCMAECLSPGVITIRDFFCIYVRTPETMKKIVKYLNSKNLYSPKIDVLSEMFVRTGEQ